MSYEKKLIDQDEKLFDEITSDLKQFMPLLNALQSNYESLLLGDFQTKILEEIVSSGIKGIEKRYEENLQKQVDNLNVTNAVLRENLLSGSNTLIQNFKESFLILKKFRPETWGSVRPILNFGFISFKNNEFYLSDVDNEAILENYCRTYLNNEKEEELYSDLRVLIESYEKVESNMNGLKYVLGCRQGKGLTGIASTFFKEIDGKYLVDPGSIKFVVDYNENQKRFK